MSCGIYMIKNKTNGHMYIGQSVNIEKRWKEHCAPGNQKKYSHLPLYQAFKKYGIDNFEFSILEECQLKELDDKEIYYIKLYNTCDKKHYNVAEGGQGRHNYHPSPETIEKYRQAMLGHEGWNKRAIYCLEKDLIADSIKEMAEKLVELGYLDSNLTIHSIRSGISRCLASDKITSHHQLHFCYLEDKDNRIEEMKKDNFAHTHRQVLCIETGKIYKNCVEAGKDVGIGKTSIRAACTGYRGAKTAKGYHWKFVIEGENN